MTNDAFLAYPGSPGAFGALMDEYARAAGEFCAVVEAFPQGAFEAERPSEDPDTASPRTIARHVCRSAWGYAQHLHRALEFSGADAAPNDAQIQRPADVRPVLGSALRATEAAGPSLATDDSAAWFREFRAWGATYHPESLLEHAICHLLRHRRQLERWS